VTDQLADDLTRVLAPILGAATVVRDVHLLTGGASRTTFSFEAITGEHRRRLILRTAPPSELAGHYAGMELEAAAQAAAAQAGAPVPRIVVASDSAAALGSPFLICDEIAGETIVRRIQRTLDDAGRSHLLEQCARALAAIHRARADADGLETQDQLAEWRGRLDEMADATATFEWAFRWLAANRPSASPTVLVHGDFRMGNLIVEGLGPPSAPAVPVLAAVLDWELVHIGEVYEDLAWFCIRAWRFGAPAALGAGGLGSVEQFIAAYERAGGAPVDRSTLHWWQVLSTLKWGVICRGQAERHLSGQLRSVELAAIGRRVCETEWDIVDLLGADGLAPPPPRPSAASSTRRPDGLAPPPPRPSAASSTRREATPTSTGRPTAAELVAAVAEFLETDVRATTSGAVNFHALVAANALRIVERELLDESPDAPRAALAGLGYASEADLAAAIRAGELDGRQSDVLACLRALVGHRLAISHPGYGDAAVS
jgi:aminoglycoside phosphotransferase (APT) family kinase protein